MMNITFPDGSVKQFKRGTTALEIAKSLSEGLARACAVAKVNDVLVDLTRPIMEDSTIQLFKFDSKEGKEVFWHSTAHILAMAVKRLYPEVKLTIGPAIEEGFYYDFDIDKTFTPQDLEQIEAEMKKIVEHDYAFERMDVTRAEAKELQAHEPYKIEMINELDIDEKITLYKNSTFIDMCRGPHLPSTGKIKAFKLTKVAGAYWRGKAENKQLQRIYGISYPDKKDLNLYLTRIEEAEKRDHRRIGKELDLIYFHEYAPGAPFFLKKGTIIYNELIEFIRNNYKHRGYDEVITPQLYNKKLWETSGHWEHYKEDMFIIKIEGEEHSLKPMNCPSHCLIYKRDVKSYKDLPVRIADFCNLHRNELSGALSGLFRVRKFAQDDGHIFCRFDQIEQEVLDVLNFIKYVWEQTFGFKLRYYLSTKPDKALGTQEIWDNAESILANALQKAEIQYEVKKGEGAFYGPKIDIDIEDAMGRKWQCPTCQLDFNLPERFELTYEGEDGKKHRPVMIHRAVLGSLERFLGIMIEHYSGKFPLWLSPIQVKVLSVADRFNEYAETVVQKMKEADIRAATDLRAETINKKVREAQLEQINYILVVGEKEAGKNLVTIRTRANEILGEKDTDEFIKTLQKEIKERK